MTSERIKEIQALTAYPQSVSVMLAMKQVWNECAQEKQLNFTSSSSQLKDKEIKRVVVFDQNGRSYDSGLNEQIKIKTNIDTVNKTLKIELLEY